MTEHSNLQTRIISDTPVSSDEFGSHQPLAKAIADLLTSEDGGMTIGLEGSWGSGKSTILNLVSDELEDKPDFSMLVFDAWAHQGDPLRRTFLETTIKHLLEIKWIDQSIWQAKLRDIRQRKKEETSRDIPQTGCAGSIFGIQLVLLPIGWAFLNVGLSNSKVGFIVLGLLFATAPLLFYAAVRIPSPILRRLKSDRDFLKDWRFLLTQQPITERRSFVFENPDPTSVEFEEYFTELIKEALTKQERHLVLAFDNLDRVASDDALSILSVLQTFLQHRDCQKAEWFKRLWVIISYDWNGLSSLWAKDTDEASESSSLAAAFRDKSFQIRFRVPPLVTTNWHRYLKNLLAHAFPGQTEETYHAVYRIFAIYGDYDNIAPTPRTLKLAVNQIGTIYRQWANRYPLTQIAYYVLLCSKKDDKEIAEELQSGNLPESEVGSLLGDSARDNIAAMLFNVDVPTAQQLLLTGPIEQALYQRNSDALADLCEHHAGFWETLENIRISDWADSESSRIANAAYCLVESHVFQKASSAIQVEISRKFQDAALHAQSWIPFNREIAEGIIALTQITNAPHLLPRVLRCLSQSPLKDRNDIDSWLDGALYLAEQLLEMGFEDTVKEHRLVIPAEGEDYILACAKLHEKDPEGNYWKAFDSVAKPEAIDDELAKLIASDALTFKPIEAIAVIEASEPDITWNTVIQRASDQLKDVNQSSPTNITALFELLWGLRQYPEATSRLSEIASQGFALHFVGKFSNSDEPELLAWSLFTHLSFFPQISSGTAIGNSRMGHQFITNQVFGNPISHQDVIEFFTNIISRHVAFDLLLRKDAPSGRSISNPTSVLHREEKSARDCA